MTIYTIPREVVNNYRALHVEEFDRINLPSIVHPGETDAKQAELQAELTIHDIGPILDKELTQAFRNCVDVLWAGRVWKVVGYSTRVEDRLGVIVDVSLKATQVGGVL